ncbi:YdbL family protein [Paraglaciecola mesophila]|jgi:uncharacterized protein YdbL (DUF1318 family)|uniref:DUF1318 domain-containing protein n=2 Tax=Paraglaciecola mesophila TaxID=197222 RepID=K6XX08_9ALTE|nr:YdbL family protein [Paraglaciecola mesophila]GAC25154.1 hypothetical protein GMES_2864 [Paraglaciecola mesophila KMM 241]|tara:strand:- start:17058 stop:17387 length:330 start_codon:yes stop_codon:yes gene_type:complete
MKTTLLPTLLAASSLLFASMSFAIELDDAKAQGFVGEQTDGYLGAVVSKPDVIALIKEVNDKRKQKYAQLASKNNLTLEQVEKLAAKKAYEKTDTGHFVLVNGAWVKKP